MTARAIVIDAWRYRKPPFSMLKIRHDYAKEAHHYSGVKLFRAAGDADENTLRHFTDGRHHGGQSPCIDSGINNNAASHAASMRSGIIRASSEAPAADGSHSGFQHSFSLTGFTGEGH